MLHTALKTNLKGAHELLFMGEADPCTLQKPFQTVHIAEHFSSRYALTCTDALVGCLKTLP